MPHAVPTPRYLNPPTHGLARDYVLRGPEPYYVLWHTLILSQNNTFITIGTKVRLIYTQTLLTVYGIGGWH